MNATATNRPEIWLIRHGETEWSKSGQHTGRTDIPLTDHGREQARALRPVLAAQTFDLVLHSPMSRARDTCEEAGLIAHAEEEPRLSEWNYGIYEGRKTVDIQADEPGWSVWTSPIPQGESVQDIQTRAESLIERLLGASGRIALFSHAHFLRVLGACWMADSAALGAHLLLDTASVSVLGFDRESRAVKQWNVTHRPA